MRLRRRSIVLIVIGAVALAGLIYLVVAPQPVPVDLSTATRGPMRVTIDADAKTRIRDIYEVAAPFPGTAQRSPVEVGDPVVEGESVVAVVEPVASGLLDARTRIQGEAAVREAEAALKAALTEIARAEAEVRYAQGQYDRAETLATRGVSSLTQLEAASERLAVQEAALEAAQARKTMAESALDRARAVLFEPTSENQSLEVRTCCVKIRAPASGVVLEVSNMSARPVAAGEKLLSVGCPDDLEIIADLLSSDAVRLKPGATATVDRWGGDTPIDARLREIEPSAFTEISALGIEEQRVNVLLDIETPKSERDGLGDGFSVYVHIVEWEAADVLQIPLSAIFRDADGWAVFAFEDGRAVLRPVEPGHENGRSVEVVDGLTEGARVISYPSDQIEDGVAIVDRTTL